MVHTALPSTSADSPQVAHAAVGSQSLEPPLYVKEDQDHLGGLIQK